MQKRTQGDSPLRLVWDRSECSITVDKLEIIAAPWSLAPFPCDVVVEEQDTFLMMGESNELPDNDDKTWYLAHKMEQQEALKPGSVIVKHYQNPLRLMAIVNDVEQEPVCREEWVWSALMNIFELTAMQKLSSMALPLLGTRYGRLDANRSMDLLQRTLMSKRASALRRLWLILPPKTSCRMLSVFRGGGDVSG